MLLSYPSERMHTKIERKVLQYVASGECKTKMVLMSRADHEALHRNSLNAVKQNQFKGAIVHSGFTSLLTGKAYDFFGLSIRRYAWKIRVEKWNEPVKVEFD
jgi:hypothetical protein